jgi:hypothetical protein
MNIDELRERLAKYPSEIQRQALLKHIGNIYRDSLYLTAKHLFDYRDITHRTHDCIIEALVAPTKRKLLVLPRGVFKSSIAIVAYSGWLLIRDPNLRILIDSEVYDNSKNFIRELRGKLMQPHVEMLFGSFVSSQWAEGSITIAQRTKVFKEASVTAGGVNTAKTGQHFEVIIEDDLNSAKNSQTPEQREKVINHHRLNTSILEPEGTLVAIGTRYASNDSIGWILDNEIGPQGLISPINPPIV